ncbi:hypothetical protein ACFL3Q_15205 [Planctomycetota bacterium]
MNRHFPYDLPGNSAGLLTKPEGKGALTFMRFKYMLSGFGRNAKRSVLIHLSFWIIGSVPLPSKGKTRPLFAFSTPSYITGISHPGAPGLH